MDDSATNDSALVAMIPFDSIEYIVYESLTISASDDMGAPITIDAPTET